MIPIPRGAILFAILFSGSAASHAQAPASSADANEVYFEVDPKRWARVVQVREPAYPPEALAQGRGAVVDVDVAIDIVGRVREVTQIMSEPKADMFEAATREALRHWLFQVSCTARCMPVESVGRVQVHFSVRDAKPVIELFHRSDDTAREQGKWPAFLNKRETYAAFEYPSLARRDGAMANVWALVTIDHLTGQVIDVEATHVIGKEEYQDAFRASVVRTMRRARFAPFEGRSKPWKLCLPVSFRLNG